MVRLYNLDESIAEGDPLHPETHVAIAQAVNSLDDRVASVETNKAPLASPNFTGNPTVPTQSAGDNSTKAASTAFVTTAVAAAGGGGAADWNTLANKPAVIAAGADAASARSAIGAGTSNLALGTTASTAKAGNYAPTKSEVGLGNVDNTSDINKPVSTAQQTALNLKANLASPAFTGNPTVPTQSSGDNSTKIASTAFVTAAVAAGGGGSGGGSGQANPKYMRPKVGEYVSIWSDNNNQGLMNFNDTDLYQMMLPEGSYNTVAITCNTAGAAGVTVRVGIYNMSADQTDIGSLVCQTGEIAASTTGDLTGSLNSTLVVPAGGGVYWVGVAAHGSTTAPTVQMLGGPSSQTPWYVMPGGGINLSGVLMWGIRKTVAGSFPSTITDGSRGWWNNRNVKVAFLRSA